MTFAVPVPVLLLGLVMGAFTLYQWWLLGWAALETALEQHRRRHEVHEQHLRAGRCLSP